jgi:hypothetical protein
VSSIPPGVAATMPMPPCDPCVMRTAGVNGTDGANALFAAASVASRRDAAGAGVAAAAWMGRGGRGGNKVNVSSHAARWASGERSDFMVGEAREGARFIRRSVRLGGVTDPPRSLTHSPLESSSTTFSTSPSFPSEGVKDRPGVLRTARADLRVVRNTVGGSASSLNPPSARARLRVVRITVGASAAAACARTPMRLLMSASRDAVSSAPKVSRKSAMGMLRVCGGERSSGGCSQSQRPAAKDASCWVC